MMKIWWNQYEEGSRDNDSPLDIGYIWTIETSEND